MPYKNPDDHPRFMVRLSRKEAHMVNSLAKSYRLSAQSILAPLISAGLGTIRKPEDLVTLKILDESFEPKPEKAK